MRIFWWGLVLGGPAVWLSAWLMVFGTAPDNAWDCGLCIASLAILFVVGTAMLIAFPIATWKWKL